MNGVFALSTTRCLLNAKLLKCWVNFLFIGQFNESFDSRSFAFSEFESREFWFKLRDHLSRSWGNVPNWKLRWLLIGCKLLTMAHYCAISIISITYAFLCPKLKLTNEWFSLGAFIFWRSFILHSQRYWLSYFTYKV